MWPWLTHEVVAPQTTAVIGRTLDGVAIEVSNGTDGFIRLIIVQKVGAPVITLAMRPDSVAWLVAELSKHLPTKEAP